MGLETSGAGFLAAQTDTGKTEAHTEGFEEIPIIVVTILGNTMKFVNCCD